MRCLRISRLPYEMGELRTPDGESLRMGDPELTRYALDCGGWKAGDTVIDLGCGRGDGLALLRERGIAAIGVDASPEALADARMRDASLAVIGAGGEDLPFADETFDGALAECSLSLMRNLPETLAELRRVLVPGGRLAVADLYRRENRASPQEVRTLPSCVSGLETRAGWESLLTAQGFELILWEDRSEFLTAFVGRLILAGGALRDLWSDVGADGEADTIAETMRRIRPGYVLFVARRRNQGPEEGMPDVR